LKYGTSWKGFEATAEISYAHVIGIFTMVEGL